jgi:hypothetical protein
MEMKNARRRRALLLCGVGVLALAFVLPDQPASAAPGEGCPDGDPVACEPTGGVPTSPDNVGTVVHVVIHKSFLESSSPDQCVGAGALSPVQRGSTALLSDGSPSADTRKVAVGVFIRSRMNAGMCEVLYIASAPVLPLFDVSFAGPSGETSVTFGPIRAAPVTDEPGIAQALRVDLQFEPSR